MYSSCGRSLKPSRRKLDKKNYDALSIPGCVIKKNLTPGAKHGASERQRMYCKATDMLPKARQPKHGGHKSMLERWHTDAQYRKSLSDIGWAEEQVTEYDKIALESHSHVTTRSERIHKSKHWILGLNQDGVQQPLYQQPDLAQAKRECKRLHDEHVTRTQQDYRTIPRDQQARQRKGQAFEGIDEHDYRVDPQTGWKFKRESQGDLLPSSSSTI